MFFFFGLCVCCWCWEFVIVPMYTLEIPEDLLLHIYSKMMLKFPFH